MKNKIKAKNLLEKSITELKQLLKEVQTEWVKLKMDLEGGKLKNVHLTKNKRKEIAQIKTILREKELKELSK